MKNKYYILDADNHTVEVDLFTWANWFESGNRTVGYTQITSEIRVSTIFLGADHRLLGEGPPILFETIVFGGPCDNEMWRYSSWDDAETGHASAVRKVRKVIGQKISLNKGDI
jgi:hypothetical protein